MRKCMYLHNNWHLRRAIIIIITEVLKRKDSSTTKQSEAFRGEGSRGKGELGGGY